MRIAFIQWAVIALLDDKPGLFYRFRYIADCLLGFADTRRKSKVQGFLLKSEVVKELAFNLFCDRTTDWIADWSEQLGKLMKLSSHKKIEDVLSTALENGESIQKVVEKLVDAYAFSPMRARATAITEVLTAHRAAAQEAYRQSPAAEYKEWRHTGSHKNTPRPNHQAISGQRVKKNEHYALIGVNGSTYHPMYPGDTDLPAAERVHCHCISQPVVSSDIMGLTIEERHALQQQAIDGDNGEWEL